MACRTIRPPSRSGEGRRTLRSLRRPRPAERQLERSRLPHVLDTVPPQARTSVQHQTRPRRLNPPATVDPYANRTPMAFGTDEDAEFRYECLGWSPPIGDVLVRHGSA